LSFSYESWIEPETENSGLKTYTIDLASSIWLYSKFVEVNTFSTVSPVLFYLEHQLRENEAEGMGQVLMVTIMVKSLVHLKICFKEHIQ
jgi:hypothetical protein